ncbi:hypothetical protein BD309DRAFT_890800 [Dichomitus squalens]|nr:hypothetical protein BD309DRAFT_890800 [Dichomitus squalens]
MLIRTARHAIPPPIALDFLIPNSILRRTLCYTSSKYSQRPPTEGVIQREPTPTAPTRPARNVTPGTVLTQLEEELHPFEAHPLAKGTNAQVKAFNKIIPELRDAFFNHKVADISNLWSALKARNLLAFFGPAHYDLCSNHIAGYVKRRALQLSEEEISALQEMALVSAAGGATSGLKALMLFRIKSGQPQPVLDMYGSYLQHLHKHSVTQGSIEEQAEEPGPDSDSASDEEATPLQSSPPSSLSRIREDILLCAVIAHAQLDTFNGAVRMYLEATTRIHTSTMEEILHRIRTLPDLRAKVDEWVQRLEAASLLSRPEALTKHLDNVTNSSASRTLQRLYARTVTGVQGPDPWLALRPEDLSDTRVVLLPSFFWSSFLTSFLACNHVELAERLWDDMLRLGVVPDVVAWNALLDGYAKLRMVDSALKTWDVMASQKVRPDALSYRAVIEVLFLAGRYQDALSRFSAFQKDLPNFRLPNDHSTALTVYNTVLYQLLFVSRVPQAKAILDQMESKGPKPDVLTLNTFIRYYGRKGDLKAVAQILRKFQPAGLKPDIYTFSTLLSAMLKFRPDADRIVINLMKKYGVSPDTTSLTAIMDRQLREATPENFKIAMDLLGKMERNEYENAEPNAITYTSVLTGINRGDWLDRKVVEEHNRRIWETMMSRGIRPSRTAYNVLLRASLNGQKPEGVKNALAYYRDMVARRVQMGNETWYILLHGLMARKQFALAQEMVKDMHRFNPNMPGALRTLAVKIMRQSDK